MYSMYWVRSVSFPRVYCTLEYLWYVVSNTPITIFPKIKCGLRHDLGKFWDLGLRRR
jgi:hypothetical protein